MIHAVFLGHPESLLQAYREPERADIARRAAMAAPDIATDAWRQRLDDLARAEVIFSTWGMPPLDAEFLAAAPRLKVVFHAAGSVKSFATPAACERGVRFCSAWEANAIPVAEFTVGAVFLSLKRVWGYARLLRETRSFVRALPVAGGYRSRVGVVSLGAIGRLVVRHLAGFDLELLAFDPFEDAAGTRALGAEPASLAEIFATCDVVSLHTPWLAETEKMVSRPLLESMREGATLINTSRGAILDEAALCQVLARRPDLTAVLDVTHPEPPSPDSPLFSLPNVVLTPHIAGSLDGEVARLGRWMTGEFARYAAAEPLEHEVTQERLATMA